MTYRNEQRFFIYEIGIHSMRDMESRIGKTNAYHQKRIERLRESEERRSGYVQKNDEYVSRIREWNDGMLDRHREKVDERIARRRQKIEDRYIREDADKKLKFVAVTRKTDEWIEDARERQDERIDRRRERVRGMRERHEEEVRQAYEDERIRETNRMKRETSELEKGRIPKRWIFSGLSFLAVLLIFLSVEFILPGSFLKRKEIIDDSRSGAELIPVSELTGQEKPVEKGYDRLVNITQEQYIWNTLLEYFGGNKTATLGVMCNLKVESHFSASCLEDYNNEFWGVNDETYTDKVNRRTIDRKDFLESRYNGITNGYLNGERMWVNRDGGYGFAQYTAYDKKEDLYKYADAWFSPGGRGENYLFNIADPKMQTNYLIRILESDEYRGMTNMIRKAESVVDACYYWLKVYEIPYDPYCDNYYTLAFERAEAAEEIRRNCDPDYRAAEQQQDTAEGEENRQDSPEAGV